MSDLSLSRSQVNFHYDSSLENEIDESHLSYSPPHNTVNPNNIPTNICETAINSTAIPIQVKANKPVKKFQSVDSPLEPNGNNYHGLFNRLTFSFNQRILSYGKKNTLQLNDFDRLCDADKAQTLSDRFQTNWLAEEQKLASRGQSNATPSLWRVLIGTFGAQYAMAGLPLFLYSAAKIVQPIILGYLLVFLQDKYNGTSSSPDYLGYILAVLLGISCLLQALVHHNYFFNVYRIGVQVRIALNTAIFRKSLTLRANDLLQISSGKSVNLIANDSARFEEFAIFFHYLWNANLEAVVVLILLLYEIGVASLVGFGLLFLFMPLQTYFSKKFAQHRKETVHWTDLRVKTVNEILSAADIVKFMGWEKSLDQTVQHYRENEMKSIMQSSMLKAINQAVFFLSSSIISLLTFLTYYNLGHTLTPAKIFTTVAYFNVIRNPLCNFVPYANERFSEARVAVTRIQGFFALKSKNNSRFSQDTQRPSTDGTAKAAKEGQIGKVNGEKDLKRVNRAEETLPEVVLAAEGYDSADIGRVTLINASCSWDPSENPNSEDKTDPKLGLEQQKSPKARSLVLESINFTVEPGKLLGIAGSVGSSKSSLLAAVLGECSCVAGSINLHNSSISFAQQVPWIYAGTIRDNILFGSALNVERYLTVLGACELIPDIELMHARDLTMVGEKGVSLSGGQRSRLALARALYKTADIYICDDVFAALDGIVAARVFQRCFGPQGILKGKTRVLVTHQLQLLKEAEEIIILEAPGRIKARGNYRELRRQSAMKHFFHSQQEEGQSHSDNSEVETEISENDAILAAKEHKSLEFDSRGDGALAGAAISSSLRYDLMNSSEDDRGIVTEETSILGTVGGAVYSSFFAASGGLISIFRLTSIMLLPQAASIFADRWLALWAIQSPQEQSHSKYQYIYVAGGLATVVLAFVRAIFFFRWILRGAEKLHSNMFHSILRTSMKFFEANPAGRILNRFSKDLSIVDELLPITCFDFLTCIILVFGSIISIAIVAPYVLLVLIPILPLFHVVRSHYIQSSRQIKRLDGTSRSPIYALFSSSLSGLLVIRAFANEQKFFNKFCDSIDDNTRVVFTFCTSARWFGLRLDVLSVFVVFITAIVCVASGSTINPGAAGFALSYSLILTSLFQWAIRQSAEAENYLTSAERIIEYGNLRGEVEINKLNVIMARVGSHKGENIENGAEGVELDGSEAKFAADELSEVMNPAKLITPPEDWPSAGCLEFCNVTMRYRPNLDLVLRGLSFAARSQEKIGICGRTGAGKSSLFQVIFRLVECNSGTILLDNIDCSKLQLERLRNSIAIIPQVPVIFSGTVRYNLDPFDECSDEQLWAALEAVQLKAMIGTLPMKLATEMAESGSNFSVGENQLLCVARAILKPSRLLLVDEASSSVDLYTDKLIQQVIREKFIDRTVLTIAHRMNTIIDSDKILVMDKGVVAEFDSPANLLLQPNSIFRSLVQQQKHH
jgi:ATP-binding cassette subfamily C (CFTR/MRP) protein 4